MNTCAMKYASDNTNLIHSKLMVLRSTMIARERHDGGTSAA